MTAAEENRHQYAAMAAENENAAEGFVLVAVALFVPPIPVYLKAGCSSVLLLNIVLWFLGWLPGVLHAFYVISKYPKHRHNQ